jgi:phosphatidylinositol 4-kinase
MLASQLASKGYFTGEVAGVRLASRDGVSSTLPSGFRKPISTTGADRLEKLPPHLAQSQEIRELKTRMSRIINDIREKNSDLTVQDLKRLLFRCAAILISLLKVLW